MDIPSWLTLACADADARGLTALRPLLEALARSTESLRRADAEFAHPAMPDGPQGQKRPERA